MNRIEEQTNIYKAKVKRQGFDVDLFVDVIESELYGDSKSFKNAPLFTIEEILIFCLGLNNPNQAVMRYEYCKITGSRMKLQSFKEMVSRGLNSQLKEFLGEEHLKGKKNISSSDYRGIFDTMKIKVEKKFYPLTEDEIRYLIINPNKLTTEELIEEIKKNKE